MREFKGLERIGAKSWAKSSGLKTESEDVKAGQSETERESGLLWTAAQVREGFVLVKFGAKYLDAARMWLGEMLKKEGTIEREFGHQALLCLR